MEGVRKKLNEAKNEFYEKIISIEHLWRRLSHLEMSSGVISTHLHLWPLISELL